jgi:hypothetical protein
MSQLRGPASSESGVLCAEDTRGVGTAQALDDAATLWGTLVATSFGVLDAGTRPRSTRELTLDETLGVLGDRPTVKLPALARLVALTGSLPPSAAPMRSVVGSHKRTRRMRAYRFKALSLEALSATPASDRAPAVENVEHDDERYVRPREGIETVKIDRLAVRRQRRRWRALVVALTVAVMVLAWRAALS